MNQRQEEGLARITDGLAVACVIGLVVDTLGPGGSVMTLTQAIFVATAALGAVATGLTLRED